MAACLGKLSKILAEGAEQGVFTVEDPDFTANQLYAQTLGTMHLARIGVGVRTVAAAFPSRSRSSRSCAARVHRRGARLGGRAARLSTSMRCSPRWARGATEHLDAVLALVGARRDRAPLSLIGVGRIVCARGFSARFRTNNANPDLVCGC